MKTGYYQARELRQARDDYFAVRISVFPCRWFKPDGEAPLLYPSRDLFNSRCTEARYRRRYFAQLDRAGVDAIGAQLAQLERMAGQRELVLLCFESLKEPGQFCHRRIFAEWWQARTGNVIDELCSLPSRPARSSFRLKQAAWL